MDVLLFQKHLLRRRFCFIILPVLLCQRSVDCIYRCLFLDSLFCSIDLSILSPVPHCLFYLFIYFYFLPTPWHMDFPGQGSDPSQSCNLHCGKARSFNPLCRAGESNLYPGTVEMLQIPVCHSGNSHRCLDYHGFHSKSWSQVTSVYNCSFPSMLYWLFCYFVCWVFLIIILLLYYSCTNFCCTAKWLSHTYIYIVLLFRCILFFHFSKFYWSKADWQCCAMAGFLFFGGFLCWFCLFVCFCFLGPHLQHMEVPRARDWKRVAAAGLHHSSWQQWIFNPLSRARDRTCVFMHTSQICYCWATGELHKVWLSQHQAWHTVAHQ